MRARVLIAVLLLALSADARIRAVRHPAPAKSVLWIAAHPDDEALAAPLLERWCVEEGARCGMLVLTRGEAGACLLPAGCHPDVRTLRSAEAAAASELFGADLILLRYPNGGTAWDRAEVAARVAGYIEAFHPDRILTFDPRHAIAADMQRHPSQFSQEWIAAVQNVPVAGRALFLAPAASILQQPVNGCR